MNKAILIGILLCVGACAQKNQDLLLFQLTKVTDDTLEIIYRGEGEAVEFRMLEGLSQTLSKNSQGVFQGQLKIQDLDNVIFSYYFVIQNREQSGKLIEEEIKPNQDDEDQFYLWVGKKRSAPMPESAELDGNLKTIDFYSDSIGAKRKVTVYSPRKEDENVPIIYLTDGRVVNDYAPYIDWLISKEIIVPVKLVGVHSSKAKRYAEYVNDGQGAMDFSKHESFFVKEILEEIESQIKDWKGNRYIYGFSNSAAFCMYAGINYPKVFKEVIAFSTWGYMAGYTDRNEFKYSSYPKFYLGAGKYESSNHSQISMSTLKRQNIDVEFKEFGSGHDYNVWRIEFMEYLKIRFGT